MIRKLFLTLAFAVELLNCFDESCIGRAQFKRIFFDSRTKAFCLLSSGGQIWLRIGSQYMGVDLVQHEIQRIVVFSCHQCGGYSTQWVNNTLQSYRPGSVQNIGGVGPHVVLHSCCTILFLVRVLAATFPKWGVKVSDQVTVKNNTQIFWSCV